MRPGERRELEWLRDEVALSARLSDSERVRIMSDLWETVELFRRSKSVGELRREEEVRQALEEEPGRARYRALIAKLS